MRAGGARRESLPPGAIGRNVPDYFGEPRRHGTSHRVYRTPWPGDPRVNIQNDRGKAKAYQVRQVLRAIEKLLEEGHDATE
jgi:hypothetical protein